MTTNPSIATPVKKRILFVDDEPNVLQGLRRMLRAMRHEWDMEFAQSGQKALEILSDDPFEVVVTDMRMPGMDGADLLGKVSERFPDVIRIILSGQSEKEKILKSVGPAHQYLSKPCDPELLKTTLTRALSLRDILSDEGLQQLISQIESLPSQPQLYLEIIEELKSPEASMDKIGQTISRDVGMMAKIFQIVNSAYFGLQRRVASPEEAVKFLGLDIIKSLVLSAHIFSQFDESKMKQFSLEKLFEHSVKVGSLAKLIAETETNDPSIIGDALVAGVLHDVGKLVLADNLSDKYREVLMLVRDKGLTHWHAEEESLGATHAKIGAYLLGLWGLPDSIVEAVAFHHEPSKCSHQQFSPLTAVHVANTFLNKEDDAVKEISTYAIDSSYLCDLGLDGRLAVWQDKCIEIKQKMSEL